MDIELDAESPIGKLRDSTRIGRVRLSRPFVILLFVNILGWVVYLLRQPQGRNSSSGHSNANLIVENERNGLALYTSAKDGGHEAPLITASASSSSRSPLPEERSNTGPFSEGETQQLVLLDDRFSRFETPIPPGLSHADFIVGPEQRSDLLSPISVEDFKTLGERVRMFLKLHRRLRALEDWQTRSRATYTTDRSTSDSKPHARTDSTYRNARNMLYEFQRFMNNFEELLFPWIRPTYPSLSYLQRTFTRGPQSRGIVMTTAKGLQSRMAMVGIMSLRATGCTLPIEFMYAGDDDLPPETRRKILSLGDGYDIVMRDITTLVDDSKTQIGAWAIKPFGIMFSSFTEVVFSDADVVWFYSPNDLFEDQVYVETGTVFYYDRRTFFGASNEQYDFVTGILPAHLKDPIPSFLQSHNAIMAKLSQHQQDSAVVVVDKSRDHNFYGLLSTCRLNLKEEREKVIYRVFLGDKETFWMGWEMAGSNGQYGWNRWPSAQLGYLVRGDQDAVRVVTEGNYTRNSNNSVEHNRLRICSYQSAHLHPDGTRLHWFNGGPLRAKFFGESSPIATALEYWAVERHSRWDINPSNIFCLRMREGLNMTVDESGNVINLQTEEFEGAAQPDSGFDYSVFKADYEQGMGGAVPHRLGKKELDVIAKLEGWWEESSREGARSLEYQL
ncbi:hypothetical protein HDU93_001278 [Gonapodya sp. JEL0774]|nr:hypothetical protein HDU93_001278 [Gonapodya sp. JEL0774]